MQYRARLFRFSYLNLSTNKVIGIHKQASKKFNFNLCTCLKFPLNDFYNNSSTVNSIKKTNSVMLDLFKDMKEKTVGQDLKICRI